MVENSKDIFRNGATSYASGQVFIGVNDVSARIMNAGRIAPSAIEKDNVVTRGIDTVGGGGPAIQGEDSPDYLIDPDDTGGGANLDGFLFYWADGTSTFAAFSTAVASYTGSGDWSVELTVDTLAMTKTIDYNSNSALFDDVGESQTKWRLPVYRDSNLVSAGGAFRETIYSRVTSSSVDPICSMIRIS